MVTRRVSAVCALGECRMQIGRTAGDVHTCVALICVVDIN